jgi:putative ABC transport system permease protein
MIKSYLTIAWRNLIKNKASSVINIGGLAVGMAVAMLIGLWIWDELSFNKYHRNYDRIAQVMTRLRDPRRGELWMNNMLQYPLVTELNTNYINNFKHVVVSSWDCDDVRSLPIKGNEKLKNCKMN